MRSVLRYPGGKSRAVKHIVPYFRDCEAMASPFFGGGWVEIALASTGVRVWGSDLFEPLVNFWRCALVDPEALTEEVEKLWPMDRDQFSGIQNVIRSHFAGGYTSMEKAAIYYAVNRGSYSGATMSGGSSDEALEKRFTRSSIERLRNFKCDNLNVTLNDFSASIPMMSHLPIYADPPYDIDDAALYGNRGDMQIGFDHDAFARTMLECERFVVSYNRSERVMDLFTLCGDCQFLDVEWAYCMNKSKKSNEVLIVRGLECERAT